MTCAHPPPLFYTPLPVLYTPPICNRRRIYFLSVTYKKKPLLDYEIDLYEEYKTLAATTKLPSR